MTGLLFAEPHRYVLDSSALFDLKIQYPREVFPGVWDKFENLLQTRKMISVREVQQEITRGTDWLVEWVEKFRGSFLEPSFEELQLVQELQERYPKLVDITSERPTADPFVIACAKERQLTILTHEKFGPQKIPGVARDYGIPCITLPLLFELERWKF